MRSYDNQPSGAVNELRRLRREAPEPERRLLRALKESFPHLKWRHQSPIGPYKPDILCFSERLIIEVDGDTHAQAVEYDAARTRFLAREGYRVIRFTNVEVMQNLKGVIAAISLSLRERVPGRSCSQHDLNSAGRCSPGSGAAQRRKGEGDRNAEGLAT